MVWIFPSNYNEYDIIGAFNKLECIDWHYKNEKIGLGDIVYLYLTKPEMRLAIKAEVIEINVDKAKLIDDYEFYKYEADRKKYLDDKFVRLKCIQIINDERLSFTELQKHGLKGNVMGKLKVNDELLAYINECMASSKALRRKTIFPRLLLCNIGWMEKYDGTGEIVGGGSYIKENNYGHEIKNFLDCDGYYYGFVESSNKRINLERISSAITGDSIDDVLIVFSAKNPIGKRTIVGYYNHATVYRHIIKKENDDLEGYYFKARVKDSCLLEPEKRAFRFNEAKKGNIGEANVWYADSVDAIEQIDRIQEYILSLMNNEIEDTKDEDNKYIEGQLKETLVTSRERNPLAREKCLKKYGYKCQICGFDFERVYGEVGKNYIHVHHIDFISNSNEEHEINPENDLIPVCPNCHAMLHRMINDRYLSIQELKDIVSNSNKLRVGDKIKHKAYGIGEIQSIDDKIAYVSFLTVGVKGISIDFLSKCERTK